MDAPESDFDIKLQKLSGDMLADFDRSLPTFLRKPDGDGGMRIRSWVRMREASRLTSHILDNFQELPQLLDPHLSKWIPFLSEAYLEYLQTRRSARRASGRSKWLIPVDRAICKILYTFCKVRGEKVVVHFLNVEAKYLELLLSAVEETETIPPDQESRLEWSWEQRYVVLLWLSHLMLAPFDLSTISSVDLAEDAAPEIPGLQWPQDLPGIALRVIPLGIKYLASPGKERDAAKLLLVRIAMRRDMQQLGVLESLMRWAVASLRPHKDAVPAASYFYLGALSFLAGILRSSSDTSDMNKYLVTIFNAVHALTAGENETAKMIVSLALARKVITKVLRSVVVLLLRQTPQDMESTELTETAIGYFLECLSDNDTPVRLAASKSLSIITLRLDPEMASQVVEAVLGSLNRNVLWSRTSTAVGERPVRDLSAVDNLEWHGLMLTLSHLLFRRSPPAEQLSDIIHALLLGLSFEQRSTTGGSVGANVRDAACFGVWALARRYSTEELVAVPTDSVFAAKAHPAASSILQVLGTELVVAGCLDPAGNIRRGASAALQELIGRHPDTVERGIGVVQTVDYHAVARRSRAIEEVAVNATKLSTQYGDALIDGILGWRGVGDVTDASRRCSGATFGALTAELATQTGGDSASRFSTSMDLVIDQLSRLEKRQVEERHGLLLCLAAVFERFPELVVGSGHDNQKTAAQILKTVTSILEECNKTTFRRPELIAEAASSLVVSSLPVLQAALLQVEHVSGFVRGNSLLSPSRVDNLLTLTSAVDAAGATHQGVDQLVSALEAVVPSWFSRNEEETIDSVSLAALLLVIFSKYDKRITILESWANLVRQKPTGRSSTHGQGYFYTLAMAQTLAQKTQGQGNSDIVCEALLGRWQVDTEIETRVAILQSLTRSRLLQKEPLVFLSLLACGLSDYTTNARGDIGSLVRVQALKAVRSLWEVIQGKGWMEASVKALFHGVLRLSGEKLDRVRPEAQAALALVMQESYVQQFMSLSFSSKTYFDKLLGLLGSDHLLPEVSRVAEVDKEKWMAELMAGYVLSADTGNEDLVIATRAALCDFCEESHENLSLVAVALWQNLKNSQDQDRVIVPTLEIIAFLFHVGLFQRSTDIDFSSLCLQTQKAGYKTGNVRKITACVKVYGGVAATAASHGGGGGEEAARAGAQEAGRRLGALMYHPWPRVRSAVVDELWGLVDDGEGAGDRLMGLDWANAGKGQVKAVLEELRLS